MLGGLQGWHLLIVLAVILLLFGAAKLPALAKSMGQSARVFKGEMNAMREEDALRTEQNQADQPDGSTAPDQSAPSGTDRTTS